MNREKREIHEMKNEQKEKLAGLEPIKLRACRIKPEKPKAKLRLVIIEAEGDDATIQAAVDQLEKFYRGL